MLIQRTSLKKGDIVALKPVEGPDIIARLAEDFNTLDAAVKISRPLEGHVVNGQGGLGIAFMPFSLSASDDQVFAFPVARLLVDPFPAREEVSSTYIAQTTSILTPTKSILTP